MAIFFGEAENVSTQATVSALEGTELLEVISHACAVTLNASSLEMF